jgi:predicted protein tyrosine phosphatase
MNILFVCSANKLRSKTADDYFSAKYPDINFQSAGTNHKTCQKEGTTPLEEEMLDWADFVYVMENKHKNEIRKHVGSKYNSKISVLHIPDDYNYYQRELIQLLENRVNIPI